MEARDFLYCLEWDFDVDAQLAAIHALLHQHGAAKREFHAGIEQLEEHARKLTGELSERAEQEWLDRLHHGVYQDAAHSMAAVGMLAPLLETIFHESFTRIGAKFFANSVPATGHSRWVGVPGRKHWDCHLVRSGSSWKQDLPGGIMELAEALGLGARLPNDLGPTLSALFAYRNKMFHLGFEWPLDEREKFAARITSEAWPDVWFSKATSGDQPWIFYLSEEFIEHCLVRIQDVLDALGGFIRDELVPRGAA